MSRIESLPYSLSNPDLGHLLGLALCGSAACEPVRMARAPRSRTKRRRWPNRTLTQPMLECRGRASPLRWITGRRRNLFSPAS